MRHERAVDGVGKGMRARRDIRETDHTLDSNLGHLLKGQPHKAELDR